MKNILVILVSSTVLATLNVPSSAQTYLYGFPSDGVSRGPYGNSDVQRYRHNDWRDSGEYRSQRNDWRDNNSSVWRRDRGDWQNTDDWRPRNRRADERAKEGLKEDPKEKQDVTGDERDTGRANAKSNPAEEDCRGPWRRDTANARCR